MINTSWGYHSFRLITGHAFYRNFASGLLKYILAPMVSKAFKPGYLSYLLHLIIILSNLRCLLWNEKAQPLDCHTNISMDCCEGQFHGIAIPDSQLGFLPHVLLSDLITHVNYGNLVSLIIQQNLKRLSGSAFRVESDNR